MKNSMSKVILPGVIDADSHFWNGGFQALSANLLLAPDFSCNDRDAITSLFNDGITNAHKISLAISSFVQYRIAKI